MAAQQPVDFVIDCELLLFKEVAVLLVRLLQHPRNACGQTSSLELLEATRTRLDQHQSWHRFHPEATHDFRYPLPVDPEHPQVRLDRRRLLKRSAQFSAAGVPVGRQEQDYHFVGVAGLDLV